MALKQVTVFSKPNCVQCNATYRWLDENGYKDAYEVGDAVDNLDHIFALLNFKAAPVVRVIDPATGSIVFWSGFNRDELKKHLELEEKQAA